MQDFLNLDLHNCIVVFDAEPVYLKLQVTNFKNTEVTANPNPQTLEKIIFWKSYILHSISQTVNTKLTLDH